MFRGAMSHYTRTKIRPYLRLSGMLEIDESKVNTRHFRCLGGYVCVRWIFGIFCRKTKIAIIYSIMDKNMERLSAILKEHITPGSLVLSDSHMSYCNLATGTSRLT